MIELAAGALAVAPGVLWLQRSRAVVAADVHFAYEDVIGGALPAWSTAETVAGLLRMSRDLGAAEIVLLGDVIHGSRMSDGAARRVRGALDALRECAALTVVAGNHEGRSRGVPILGETVESVQRDGWMLLHGDRAPNGPLLDGCERWIIGHLHPSLPLEGRESVSVFASSRSVIALPAVTPYSRGLDVRSFDFARALRFFGGPADDDIAIVAVEGERCYRLGSLSTVRLAMRLTAFAQGPSTPHCTRHNAARDDID